MLLKVESLKMKTAINQLHLGSVEHHHTTSGWIRSPNNYYDRLYSGLQFIPSTIQPTTTYFIWTPISQSCRNRLAIFFR